MKKLIYICFLLFFTAISCKKEKITDRKQGVSLPTVSNLALQKTADKEVKLTWNIPAAIPDQVQQPLSVFIEVNEIISVTKAVSVFSTTVANAPTTFVYQLSDATKKYHFTVKLVGNTKTSDVNYSSVIYSLGQTVNYNE